MPSVASARDVQLHEDFQSCATKQVRTKLDCKDVVEAFRIRDVRERDEKVNKCSPGAEMFIVR